MTGDGGERTPVVLVVEDEWLLAAATIETLTKAGYAIAGPARSMREALVILDERAVDAAVVDVWLDEEPSFVLADRLLGLGVPFVFTTGYVERDLPDRYRPCPVLGKPVAAEVLVETLRRLLPDG